MELNFFCNLVVNLDWMKRDNRFRRQIKEYGSIHSLSSQWKWYRYLGVQPPRFSGVFTFNTAHSIIKRGIDCIVGSNMYRCVCVCGPCFCSSLYSNYLRRWPGSFFLSINVKTKEHRTFFLLFTCSYQLQLYSCFLQLNLRSYKSLYE